MDKQIYYTIKHVDGLFDLYSVMNTSFGGPAYNYVKSEPFRERLVSFAENQGWIKWTGEGDA